MQMYPVNPNSNQIQSNFLRFVYLHRPIAQ